MCFINPFDPRYRSIRVFQMTQLDPSSASFGREFDDEEVDSEEDGMAAGLITCEPEIKRACGVCLDRRDKIVSVCE